MSRFAPITSLSTVLVSVLFLSGACGHTETTLDAFHEAQKAAPSSTGDGDGVDVNPNVFPDSAYANVPTCEPPTSPDLPKFDCTQAASLQFDEANMKGYCVPPEVTAAVDQVLGSMSAAHKATQMIGVPVGGMNYRDIERSPDVIVPGIGEIRGYRYRDAGRGVNLDAGQDNRPDDKKNYATAFPVSSLRAASWDLDLERRLGAAIGDETAASLNNMNLGPCMNIVRHPYWGRTQETYGEDAYGIGRMSAAYSVGVQEFVVGCAKHFAANNVERFRSKQNAVMSEQTLREIYGRHFEMVIQDGAIGCIMAAYNLINDEKATQSAHLLRDILKAPVSAGGMGFEGLVITDWWAMPGDQETKIDSTTAQTLTNEAVIAGTDIEVPWQIHYSEATLANAEPSLVEEATRRILTQKFLFNSAKANQPWSKKKPTSVLPKGAGSLAPNQAHEDLAQEAVERSAVLLVNGTDQAPVLPWKTPTSIAVIGMEQPFKQISSSVPPTCGYTPDAGQGTTASRECTFDHGADPALGDRGSSRVNGDPARSVGPFAGIKQIGETLGATVTNGKSAADVGAAEAVVVVVGYTPGDEGEEYYIQGGGDRSSLNLPTGQNELVQSVLDLGKPTVIIIQSGSVVNLPWLDHSNTNQATFWAGYPGMRGGLAYARLIFGQANFAGKMPMAWPTQAQLDPQIFRPEDPKEVVTEMGYFFGYRLYDKLKYIDNQEVDLVFPFGHGLSYSKFEYSDLAVPCTDGGAGKDGIFEVTVKVTNTTDVPGDEVVFLFVKPPAKPEGITGERPWKELKSFARVHVPAMGSATASLPVRVHDLRRWEGLKDGKWVIDSGEYTIAVGKDAEAVEAEGALTGTVMVNGD
jgi:beta-glucosidase